MDEFYNIEAEQVILGSIIMQNIWFSSVSDLLKSEHFYEKTHQAIWDKIEETIGKQGSYIDQVLLRDFCINNDMIKSAGGNSYLNTLLIRASGTIDIRHYAKIIVELWQKRKFIELSEQSILELRNKSFGEVSSNFENELVGLEVQEARKKTQNTQEIIDEMDNEVLSDEFITTSFTKLDEYLNGGIYKQQLVFIGARPSVGKAQPMDANILTLDGWKKMGDLKIGEKLASIDGKDSQVVGIYPQGTKEIFKITFQDGRQVECCKEHLWKVYYRDWKEAKVLTTERLIEMLKCARYKRRLWIDEFSGEFGQEDILPIDAWVLGVLIGDGGLTGAGINFTNSNFEIVDKLKDKIGNNFEIKLKGKKSKIDYSIIEKVPCFFNNKRINRLKEKLTILGLYGCHSYEKFIPAQYLKSHKRNRLELLRGLLDTDGYVGKSGQITYSTSSQQLAKDVVYLAQSLGAATYSATKKPFYTYKGQKKEGRLHYIIQISYSKGSEFLSFSKKQARTRVAKNKHKRNTFASIEQVGFKNAQCIKVSHSSELYITNNFIVTHNTSIAQNIILGASLTGKRCFFISLEVDKKNVIYKFLSILSSVGNWKIQKKQMYNLEYQDFLSAKEQLRQMKIAIDDSSYLTISQIGRLIKNRLDREPIDLVVVDYIQIVRGDDVKGKNEAQIIKENTTILKSFAKRFNVGVLCLAQINRKAVEGAKQEPTINDFKSSGGIEEDADVAIILHRDRNDEKKEGYFSNAGKLIIAKNRHGRTGEIAIKFDGATGKFEELGGVW